MKVALVYDRVNKWGGAESVLLALHEIFPQAPLYTSVYDKNKAPWAKIFDVRTSFLQSLPIPKNKHEYYPFLMGIAFESFNFDEFDLVISITSEFAKAIITKPSTLHVCYCLTPTSYLWSGYQQYFSNKSNFIKKLTLPLVKFLRYYDRSISSRPDKYIAISKAVQYRISKYYGKESIVVYPPVNIELRSKSFLQNKNNKTSEKTTGNNYFLIVSRLVPNKRIDIAVRAFNELGLDLKVIGTGRQENDLKSLAKDNIEFLGSLTQEQLGRYYDNCLALIVPAAEDFGIVAVEAQSHGKPVLAFRGGGNLETIIENKTGWFFDEPTAQSLVVKITEINKMIKNVNPITCIENSKRYSKGTFHKEFKIAVNKSD